MARLLRSVRGIPAQVTSSRTAGRSRLVPESGRGRRIERPSSARSSEPRLAWPRLRSTPVPRPARTTMKNRVVMKVTLLLTALSGSALIASAVDSRQETRPTVEVQADDVSGGEQWAASNWTFYGCIQLGDRKSVV